MNRLTTSLCALMLCLALGSGIAAAGTAKTVEQLYQEKAELSGEQVMLQGTVVKVNNNIMNRNFIHIQDGTGAEGSNNVTITSNQTASVGDEVTVNGTVAIDKDFGAGYVYPLLLEEATISSQ